MIGPMHESHWISDTVSVQQVQRHGMHDLFVGGADGKSAAFYDANELAAWLIERGVSIEDPVWDYLEQLEPTELY